MPRRTVDDNPMPKRQSSELDYMIKIIDIEKIDPSPFQRRKYFNEHKLKELVASIQREGLIEPIVVRPYSGRYQLIAGERRWRAIRDYTNIKTIQSQTIIDKGDVRTSQKPPHRTISMLDRAKGLMQYKVVTYRPTYRLSHINTRYRPAVTGGKGELWKLRL